MERAQACKVERLISDLAAAAAAAAAKPVISWNRVERESHTLDRPTKLVHGGPGEGGRKPLASGSI